MIGSTVSTIGGLVKGIERASACNYDCTQIYTTNSRIWNPKPLDGDEVIEITEASSECKVILIAHAPLLLNLASTDPTIRRKSGERLLLEIGNASVLGIESIVVHPGSYIDGSPADGILRLVNSIERVIDVCEQTKVKLLLETMSGQGTQLGHDYHELADTMERLDCRQVGVCLDTSHLYASGYDISSPDKATTFLDGMYAIIPKSKIGAIHLNNTKIQLGGLVDRHSSIFDGEIELSTFSLFVRMFSDIPKVVEPPSNDITGQEQVSYLQRAFLEEKNESRQ